MVNQKSEKNIQLIIREKLYSKSENLLLELIESKKEIKLEDGRQLLIENDAGYISPEDNKQIISEMKDLNFSEDLILNAVLQKYGIPNKNGRIYPESVLRRENEKYQKLIKTGGALSELNHPTCQCGDNQILTQDGWKNLQDISDFEKIYTLNENGKIELKTIYEKKKYFYNDTMIHLKGRHIDILVTPNHKFPIIDKNNKKLLSITAQEIFNSFKNNNKLSRYYIPKTCLFNEINENENFIIKGLKNEDLSFRLSEKQKILYKQDIIIPTNIFAAFMGIYLSEGHVVLSKMKKRKAVMENGEESYYESSNHGYSIGITQKDSKKIKLIEELMDLFPLKSYKNIKKDGTASFTIHDRRLHKYLKPLGKSHQKYIPNDIKNLSPYYLNILFDWFKLGDGRTIGQYKQSDVFSTSQKLIEDLQEILIKCGKSGNIRREERNINRYINENGKKRLIKGENTKPMWFLNISKTKGIWLDNRFLNVYEENYNDFIYSVDVPNHIYYTKSNEKCHWTGNSSLIDLDRVSHSILETWWDGNILMGKIKIYTSPGWKKMGIISCKGDQTAYLIMIGSTLGISSRGVGSLKSEKGQNIVQDDYEIICFDIVSSPSTPGAYIFNDPSELKHFEEIEEMPVEKNDKIKSLMGTFDRFLGK